MRGDASRCTFPQAMTRLSLRRPHVSGRRGNLALPQPTSLFADAAMAAWAVVALATAAAGLLVRPRRRPLPPTRHVRRFPPIDPGA